MEKPQTHKNALIILIIGFAVVFFSSSIKNTFQVFFVQMTESFGQARGEFAVAMSVFMLVFGIASPIIGLLSDKIGPKKTILYGLALSGIAMLGSGLIDNFYAFVFLYGVIAAFGLTAMSYVPIGVLVDQSFSHQRKGLAYATLTNGAAIGFIVLSPVWVFLQEVMPWQYVFVFLGILFLVPLFLMVKIYLPDDPPSELHPEHLDKTALERFNHKLGIVFKNKPFYALMLGFFGCGVTMAFIDVHLVAHFQDLKLSTTKISIALSVLGAAELIGAFAAGWLCGKYPKSYVIAGFYLIRAIAIFYLLLVPEFSGAFVFVVLFGLSYLGTVVGTSLYTLSIFGKQLKGFAFGFIWLFHQVGAFLSTQLGASSYDWFGSYDWTILMTGVVAIISCLISFILLPANDKNEAYTAAQQSN